MTVADLFRKAADMVAEQPVSACVALARASGNDAMIWKQAQMLFVAHFCPDDKTALAPWWPNWSAKTQAERTLALLFMAEIAEEKYERV